VNDRVVLDSTAAQG